MSFEASHETITREQWARIADQLATAWPGTRMGDEERALYFEVLKDLPRDSVADAVVSLIRDVRDEIPPPGVIYRRATSVSEEPSPSPDPVTSNAFSGDALASMMAGRGAGEAGSGMTIAASAPGASATNGAATAALVLGIVGFIVPIVCSILAVVFGAIGMGAADKLPNRNGRGMALAGLVLGIVGAVLWLLFFAAV